MSEIVSVVKDEGKQRLVPSIWRATFFNIVEVLKSGDLAHQDVAGVDPISLEEARRIAINIENYGAHITTLSEETWKTSVCQWMGGHWNVLIDLFTIEEGASDLVLEVKVREDGAGYSFEIHSVYVP